MTHHEALALVLAETDWEQAEDLLREQVREDDPQWFRDHPAAVSADHPTVARYRAALTVLRQPVGP